MTKPHASITAIGPLAAQALEKNGKGRVSALFPSVFYANLPGGLVAITSALTAPGPLNLTTNHKVPNWPKTGLKVGTSVHVFNGILHIAGLAPIDTRDAKPWLQPQSPAPDPHSLQSALTRLEAQKLTPPREGYGTTLTTRPATETATENGLASALHGDLSNLAWAHHLIGRGPGLTPAGDDFLGGAMIALHCLGRAETAQTLWAGIEQLVRQNTNPISCALLAAAARGMGSAPLHQALTATLTGKNLAPALAELNRIGHSSGWDAFAGAVLTFRAALAPRKAAA